MAIANKSPAIFLDRDGVINEDRNYVHKIEEFNFIPGIFEPLKLLQSKGFKLFIVTNQSGIGRGLYSEEEFLKLNKFMLNKFNKKKIKIEKVYYCKHKPEDNCECRKPKIKFVKDAEKEFNLDLKKSWVIGDRMSDIELGKNAGCNYILLDSEFSKNIDIFKLDNLSECAELIIKRNKK